MHYKTLKILLFSFLFLATGLSQRMRYRDMGLNVGELKTGKLNSITDVKQVRVGHHTVNAGGGNTGVTAILPHGGNLFQNKVPAAIYIANGFGKLAGYSQVEELGNIETPIILTNTLSVGQAVEAVVKYSLQLPENRDVRSVNAIVGETNDGYLNDIRGMHVKESHIFDAIKSAKSGVIDEGSVGAGYGTICFGFKGGIGTSSRLVELRNGQAYTVGVLVQSNFGRSLRIHDLPIGQMIKKDGAESGDGSCMIVIATDAPISVLNLKRMAKRAPLGLARTGSVMSNGSGDYVIAFTNAYTIPYRSNPSLNRPDLISNDYMTLFFQAVVEATQEAVYNSLFMATDVTGYQNRTINALPLEKVKVILEKHGLIKGGIQEHRE